MDIGRKKELLAEILDVEPEEIVEGRDLADLGEWDSLSVLSYIAMMDEEFGKEVSGPVVKAFVTVDDALALMEE